MYEEVQVLTHSSIRIAGNQIIYFDPFHVEEETHDADIICVTHEHFDHYSPEDLAKVKKCSNDSCLSEVNEGFIEQQRYF